ncbi:single-pass membrane and coiled-coil domain-containing protein 4 isoform X1 [Sapajus apella]|uniref:Single-pass membrane and coiled-coil domain-containing protein 4 isoform X1 n=1 Tax=Sapajus apella TaxID=9515 RepID=A0A6J3JAZ9_SAPAP|nr:single-pass membrane and coiled-coil domain-containing protein 4 isoform X1 [Sapajus apella]
MFRITQVTCTGDQFAEIIQATILEVEEKSSRCLLSTCYIKGIMPAQENIITSKAHLQSLRSGDVRGSSQLGSSCQSALLSRRFQP